MEEKKFDLKLFGQEKKVDKFDLKYFTQEENIVKKTCKELNVTRQKLAELIGVSETSINRWASNPKEMPLQAIKTFEILLENKRLKEFSDTFKKLLQLTK
jgi:DNA-binding XRE family transcriptional regulator